MLKTNNVNISDTKKSIHWVTKSFLIVFSIVLLEGALRKWLNVPTIPLMGLRDLVVIFSIVYGLKYFNFRAFPEVFLLVWTFTIVILALSQNIVGLIPVPVVVIGIRSWLLYFWFALLCFRVFTKQDLVVIIKFLILTIIPMAILATIQQLSPVDAFINKQPPGAVGEIFTVVAGIVRPTATFTFTIGYSNYLSMIGPFIFWLISGGERFIENYTLKLIIVGSYFLGVIVSGSRGTLAMGLIMIIAWFITKIITKKLNISTKTVFLMPLIIGIGIYFLAPIVERATDANLSRIETASESENGTKRLINTFVVSNRIQDQFQLFGYGIGAASNAAGKFMDRSVFALGESEIDRIFSEGGIFGFFYEIIKVSISIFGLILSLKILVKSKNTLPFLFWVYLLLQLLTSPTSGQITVHAFTFLSLGLGWSLLRNYKRENF